MQIGISRTSLGCLSTSPSKRSPEMHPQADPRFDKAALSSQGAMSSTADSPPGKLDMPPEPLKARLAYDLPPERPPPEHAEAERPAFDPPPVHPGMYGNLPGQHPAYPGAHASALHAAYYGMYGMPTYTNPFAQHPWMSPYGLMPNGAPHPGAIPPAVSSAHAAAMAAAAATAAANKIGAAQKYQQLMAGGLDHFPRDGPENFHTGESDPGGVDFLQSIFPHTRVSVQPNAPIPAMNPASQGFAVGGKPTAASLNLNVGVPESAAPKGGRRNKINQSGTLRHQI